MRLKIEKLWGSNYAMPISFQVPRVYLLDGHLDSQDLGRQIGGIDDGADDVEAVSEADVGRVGGGVAVASEGGVWIKVDGGIQRRVCGSSGEASGFLQNKHSQQG